MISSSNRFYAWKLQILCFKWALYVSNFSSPFIHGKITTKTWLRKYSFRQALLFNWYLLSVNSNKTLSPQSMLCGIFHFYEIHSMNITKMTLIIAYYHKFVVRMSSILSNNFWTNKKQQISLKCIFFDRKNVMSALKWNCIEC